MTVEDCLIPIIHDIFGVLAMGLTVMAIQVFLHVGVIVIFG